MEGFVWWLCVVLFGSVDVSVTAAFSPSSSRRHGQRPCLQMSSFVDGVQLHTLTVPRETLTGDIEEYKLAFRYVARHTRKPAVVVLHGGPSLPSAYLYNLADLGFRSMLFYDQLGCGKSDQPSDTRSHIDETLYTPSLAAKDLETIITAVLGPSTPYHLYGHAYGGCLAYEFLRKQSTTARKCRSVVLSSASVNVRQTRDAQRKMAAGGTQEFTEKHVCRIRPTPSVLAAAYQYPGKVWKGMKAFTDYAVPSSAAASPLNVPCLAVRGEYDFVSDTQQWKRYFTQAQAIDLPECSHHGLYENPGLYAETLRNFWSQHDY